MAPQISISWFSEPVNVTLCGKRDFVDVVKLRVLRRGDYPGLSGLASCNHNHPYKRRQQELEFETMTWEQEQGMNGIIHFEDGWRCCKPRSVGGHWKLNTARKHMLFSEVPEGPSLANSLTLTQWNWFWISDV